MWKRQYPTTGMRISPTKTRAAEKNPSLSVWASKSPAAVPSAKVDITAAQ